MSKTAQKTANLSKIKMGVALGFLGLSALAAAAAGQRLAKQSQFDQKASQKAGAAVSPTYPNPDHRPTPQKYPVPTGILPVPTGILPDPDVLNNRKAYPNSDGAFPDPDWLTGDGSLPDPQK